jgi:CDGSH-type Zn-finger protein/truncated hemoglobin YjbI
LSIGDDGPDLSVDGGQSTVSGPLAVQHLLSQVSLPWMQMTAAADPACAAVLIRLRDSAIRPLADAAGEASAIGSTPTIEAASAADFGQTMVGLAKSAAMMIASGRQPIGVAWAAASLQDLALQLTDAASGAQSRLQLLNDLAALQPATQPGVQVTLDGPYLITGEPGLATWLGESIEARPVMALCRCGESALKPDCDGACVRTGFSGSKSPERVPDNLDTYAGVQVTVLDNRGICQHSGYCTDRLPTVFRQSQEPFVAPSGGRMDEIIRAVRDCPSGALSFAVDDVEARLQVDHSNQRNPSIEISHDGPYRITGSIPLVDEHGVDVVRAQGASREHYALCRCGHSQNKPFCNGMHWFVDFKDPAVDPDHAPSMFEWCGGLPALLRMTRVFYEKYGPNDPLLAPIFANMAADHPQRVAAWLGEVFGGPASYSGTYGGYERMISQHVGKEITEEWRARWVTLLTRSAVDAELPNDPEFRSAFGSYVEWGSRLAVENSQQNSHPPAHLPMPHWDWGTAGPPGSRISALAPLTEKEPAPVVLPAAGEPVSFDQNIRPLFRASDRQSMRFAFDLGSYDDVCQHADGILARLTAGTMPCDGAWPPEQVATFQSWITHGKAT